MSNEGAQCPYCKEQVNPEASRCPHCAGEIPFCPNCKKHVAVETKRKWVGIFRGGTQEARFCIVCRKQLSGPRW